MCVPNRNAYIYLQIDKYKNIHGSTAHNSPKEEPIQMLFSCRMDTLVYSCHEILHSNENEEIQAVQSYAAVLLSLLSKMLGKVYTIRFYLYCCCCSVPKPCPALCDPMDRNTPSFPVLHYLLEFAQTHVH